MLTNFAFGYVKSLKSYNFEFAVAHEKINFKHKGAYIYDVCFFSAFFDTPLPPCLLSSVFRTPPPPPGKQTSYFHLKLRRFFEEKNHFIEKRDMLRPGEKIATF